jgi:hypothetical protein
MSFDRNNLGKFDVNRYSGGSGQRMAGDYLSDFTSRFSDNSEVKGVTSKDYRGNVKNNNVSSFLGNSAPKSVTQSKKPTDEVTAQPVGNPTPAAGSGDGIDYAAWAKDTLAKGGGQDEAYWINQYQKNNAEFQGSKEYLDSYVGPKTWDEFTQIDQNRSGNTAQKNQGTIADYGKLTEYMTKKNNYDQWMDNTQQWRTDS